MTVWIEEHLLLLTVTVALGVNVFLTLYLALRMSRTVRNVKATEAVAAALRDDVRALCSGAVGVGKRLARVEEQLLHQEHRQDQLELRDSSSDQAYDHAVRLVQRGVGLDELMSTCALTRGEAELIMMLHRYDSVRTAATGRQSQSV